MDISSDIRSSVIDLDRRTFIGSLVAIIGVGLAVKGAYVTSILLNFDLLQVLMDPLQPIVWVVPLVIGALVYVRNRPAASIWEIGLVILWGMCALYGAFLFIFFFGPVVSSDVRISTILASRGTELVIWELLRNLGTAAVFAGLCAVAASRRDRLLLSVLVLLMLPVGIVGVWAIA